MTRWFYILIILFLPLQAWAQDSPAEILPEVEQTNAQDAEHSVKTAVDAAGALGSGALQHGRVVASQLSATTSAKRHGGEIWGDAETIALKFRQAEDNERAATITADTTASQVEERSDSQKHLKDDQLSISDEHIAADLDIYGRFAAHLRYAEGDRIRILNNSSRFGLHAFGLVGSLTFQGRAEWAISLGEADEDFNLEAGSEESTSPALSTRLGYLGVNMGDYGQLFVGKQWSVYYDVTGWTDAYIVFGGRASSTFNSGTDGGISGTGRANNAISYRVELWESLKLGAQGQWGGDVDAPLDSFGATLRYRTPIDVSLGVTYNHRLTNSNDFSFVSDYDGKAIRAFSAGVKYDRGAWWAAGLYTRTWNQEIEELNPDTFVFIDTDGVELFVGYQWMWGLKLYGGGNLSLPREPDPAINEQFKEVLAIAGALYRFLPFTFVYLEGQVEVGRDNQGDRPPAVIALGMRLDYSSILFRDKYESLSQ